MQAGQFARDRLTAVVGDVAAKRTPKMVLAWIFGLPILKPSWVHACSEAAVPPMTGHHMLRQTAAPWTALQGVTVTIDSGVSSKHIPVLLRHAGQHTVSSVVSSLATSISQRYALVPLHKASFALRYSAAGPTQTGSASLL